MSTKIYAGWEFGAASDSFGTIGPGSLVIEEDSPNVSDTFALSSSKYSHVDISSVESDYQVFPTVLATLLNASGTLNNTYSVSFSTTTGRYTISRSTGSASFRVTGATTANMQNILGIASTPTSYGTSVTGDNRAYYAILIDEDARADDVEDYQESGTSEVFEADDGTRATRQRTSLSTRKEFSINWQPKAAVLTREAASTEPWTWERFFKHVKVKEPFVLVDSLEANGLVMRLRPDGDAFQPQRVQADWTEYFSMRFSVFVEGRL